MNLNSQAWKRLRATILQRDHHTCHWCGAPARTVDHLVERDRGGSDDPDNLVAACTRCNSSRGAKYGNTKRTGAGRRIGW